jgi:hypothetical protein
LITKEAIEKTYLKKVKIELGEYFGVEPGEVWVELREPETLEMLKLQSELRDNENQISRSVELFHEMLPGLIVSHCFYSDEKGEKKMKTEEVRDILYRKYQVVEKILSDFFLKCIPRVMTPGK